MTARDKKQRFIEDNTALSKEEAALILGCEARDVDDFIQPSFRINGNPKYIASAVKARQNKFIRATAQVQEQI